MSEHNETLHPFGSALDEVVSRDEERQLIRRFQALDGSVVKFQTLEERSAYEGTREFPRVVKDLSDDDINFLLPCLGHSYETGWWWISEPLSLDEYRHSAPSCTAAVLSYLSHRWHLLREEHFTPPEQQRAFDERMMAAGQAKPCSCGTKPPEAVEVCSRCDMPKDFGRKLFEDSDDFLVCGDCMGKGEDGVPLKDQPVKEPVRIDYHAWETPAYDGIGNS
jgi:hypothetical protein